MDLHESDADRAFRDEVRTWLCSHVKGEYAKVGGRGGSGDESYGFEARRAWEFELAKGGWTCLAWPKRYGGKDASIAQQVIWYEEYVRAKAPGRVSILGEGLLGPTLLEYGTEEQKQRFLPPIRSGEVLWCQGYSEPDAGSDLASVRTSATKEGGSWILRGEKIWTSLAHQADWAFVLCRSDPSSLRHHGLSYLLVPMDQKEIHISPILQMTGTSEFNSVFFDGARTDADLVVGQIGEGWKVALATLSYERGAGLLGHQLSFLRELEWLLQTLHDKSSSIDPVMRDRLTKAYGDLMIMRLNSLRSLGSSDVTVASPSASIAKMFWSRWHRDLGNIAMDALGPTAMMLEEAPYVLKDFQRSFLFSRAETIYGGSDEIQHNIGAERILGLPSDRSPLTSSKRAPSLRKGQDP